MYAVDIKALRLAELISTTCSEVPEDSEETDVIREYARTPDQQTDNELLLPDHLCANEAERHEWRAEV